jgi:hypothetical protein
MRRTNFYNRVALSGDRQPSQSRRTVLDRVLAATSKSLQMNNTYMQYFVSLRDLPNPPEQGIVILSQRAAPTNDGPRRYGEGAPDQFSEIAVLMGDEPKVSDLVIQWRPDTTDLYRDIKIIREDHRSGDTLCYPLLFPYGTDGWTLEQHLYTVNVQESQNGQVVYFERFKVQVRGTTHMITPKEFYNYRLMPRHGSPRSSYLFSFIRLFQDFLVNLGKSRSLVGYYSLWSWSTRCCCFQNRRMQYCYVCSLTIQA